MTTTETHTTLVGRTIRPVCFARKGDRTRPTLVTSIITEPAGVEVYVSRVRSDGTCTLRIPGTLYEARVYFGSVEPS
jgi:hypothetical protein